MPDVRIRDGVGPTEHPRLVEIWRSAVDATHDFLAAEDRSQIEKKLAVDYFPRLHLTVADSEGRAVGFAGTVDGKLEMLFVDASSRGQGLGKSLLDHVIRHHGVHSLDVNEQNGQAAGFYSRYGFRVNGRSEVDGSGRPYPILHMVLDSETV